MRAYMAETWVVRSSGEGRAGAQDGSISGLTRCRKSFGTARQTLPNELLPQSLALQFPERTALATYLPMRWSMSVYRGFIWLLNGTGFLLLRPFGVVPGGHEHVHSPEELAVLFAELRRGGSLSPESHRRLDRGLQLSARTVRQMMTPRSDIDAIEVSTPADELLRRILRSPYSWLPVYHGTLDQIVGAVSIKAVVGHFAASGRVPSLSELLRPMPFVPDSLRSHRFVRFLQERRASKAIVVDEHGGVQGIISIEDVLWELFGEISDELKQPEPIAEVLPDGKVRLPGSMRLDEAEPWLRVHWVGPAATVGGQIVEVLGRLPAEGESVEIDGARVTITEMSPTAVRWVVVEPRSDAPGSADNASKQDVRR